MIQSSSCVILFCLILLLRQGLAVLELHMQEGVTDSRSGLCGPPAAAFSMLGLGVDDHI